MKASTMRLSLCTIVDRVAALAAWQRAILWTEGKIEKIKQKHRIRPPQKKGGKIAENLPPPSSCCFSQHLGILGPPNTAKQGKRKRDKSTLFPPPPPQGPLPLRTKGKSDLLRSPLCFQESAVWNSWLAPLAPLLELRGLPPLAPLLEARALQNPCRDLCRGLWEPLWEANFSGEPRGGLSFSDGDPPEPFAS